MIKNKINPSDSQRTIRAYEVKLYTKRSIYDWFKNTKNIYQKKDFYKIYIDFPREELLKRINIRVQKMIKNGLVSEVKRFNKIRLHGDKMSKKAIGIKEVSEYLQKKIEIEDVIEKISIKTRQYAKRQRTWANGNMQDWIKMNPKDLNNFLKKFLDFYHLVLTN